MRTSSPATATTRPARHVVHVGRASRNVATTTMPPSATRLRASASATVTAESRIANPEPRNSPADARSPVHCAHHLGDADLVDAALLDLASPLVHARALMYARDRHVVEAPWAVSFRPRRSEQ